MRKIITPICREILYGKRNYFDCYEAAVGGLLQYHLNDTVDVKSLYSLFDAVSLSIDDEEKLFLHSRALDVNSLMVQVLGFEPLSFSDITALVETNTEESPFIVDFDEYYFEGYHNYQTCHFTHAALAADILDRSRIIILDPVLEFMGDSCCVEKILRVPDYPDNVQALTGTILRKRNDFHPSCITDRLVTDILINNIEVWRGGETNTGGESHFFGLTALEKFTEALNNNGEYIFGTDFYKWIYPIVWKEEYLQKFNDFSSLTISSHLRMIINEMEQFETILLRLKSSGNARLRGSALKRWDDIVSMAYKYISLERERIGQYS
jgi:hypothetical protein